MAAVKNTRCQLSAMAMLVTPARCAIILRGNTTLPLISQAKIKLKQTACKRSYHVCHKAKHMIFKYELSGSVPLSRRRKLDILSVSCNRYLSSDLSADGNAPIENVAKSPPIVTTAADSSSAAEPTPISQAEFQAVAEVKSSEIVAESAKVVDSAAEFIPEPPTPPVTEIVNTVQEVAGEPTFASLGLGGWSPVGIVQNCMEYLHIDCALPWWGAIAIGTAVVRIVIFPLVIIAQRNAAKMNNHLPQLQFLQMKMTESRQTGNQLEAARYAQEMASFMKEKNLNPLKNMLVPLAQAPLFISFFLSLRKMATCPVESMKEGGLFWFTDLTMPDQYFLLPILTSATLWVTIEVGTDSAKLTAGNMQLMKYFLRAMPVIILPFTVNFPGAILCYWACSNFISLGQVGILKIPAVREYFKIEKHIHHKPETLPIKPKGFTKGFKESWENMKITRELEERQKFDEMQFLKAGRGPIQKTYKHDPTRVVKASPKVEDSSKTKIK